MVRSGMDTALWVLIIVGGVVGVSFVLDVLGIASFISWSSRKK